MLAGTSLANIFPERHVLLNRVRRSLWKPPMTLLVSSLELKNTMLSFFLEVQVG